MTVLTRWVEETLEGQWADPEMRVFILNGPQKMPIPPWLQIGQPGEGGDDILITQDGEKVILVTK